MLDILPHALEDTALSGNLIRKIKDYYQRKIEQAVKTGDAATFNSIASALEVNTNSTNKLDEIITKNKEVNKAALARDFEIKGINALKSDDLNAAEKNFKAAVDAYPGFHSAYEISKVIKEKKKLNMPAEEASKEVLKEIKTKYNWKINKDLLK